MVIFKVQHHNAIAKDIRNELHNIINEQRADPTNRRLKERCAAGCAGITYVALRLARRFELASSTFNPYYWLDQCSPEVDLMPLSELYDDYLTKRGRDVEN